MRRGNALFCQPLAHHALGGFILIDRLTNVTVGAGMIVEGLAAKAVAGQYSEFEVELNALVRKHFPHWQALTISNDSGKE